MTRAGSAAPPTDGVASARIAEADARSRILASALQEFASRGFDGSTTAGIARGAGVTQPLVHYHFATKDELWKAAVSHELLALVATFEGIVLQLEDLDPVDRMKVIVRRFVMFMAEHSEFGRIMSYEGVQGGDRFDWLIERGGSGRLRSLDELLASGVEQGWAKPLPTPHVASCLTAAASYFFIVRASVRKLYDIDVDDPEIVRAHADTVVELFFHGLVRTEVVA